MTKTKKETKPKIVTQIESNPKIEEIIADYPDSIHGAPRLYFEEQLRSHLLKHKIK